MRALQLLSFCLILCVCAGPARSAPASAADLKRKLSEIIVGNPNLRSAKVGVYVRVLKTGRVVFNYHGTDPMIPASNLKLVTTSAAIDRLGPEFRYNTEVLGPALNGGVVPGNLYLKGSGDPTFGYPYCPPMEPLQYFAKQLHAQGVRSIGGDVVADDSAFDREFIGKGWYDRYLLDSYAAPVGALSLNNNLVDITVTAQKLILDPPSPSLPLLNKVKVGGYSEVWLSRERGDERTVINGVIAPGGSVRRQVTVGNPSLFTLGAFTCALQKSGIHIEGQARLIEALESARERGLKTYVRWQSPPLRSIIAQVNKESDNVFAQHVFKTLGENFRGRGTAANGEAAVRDFMRRHGIDDTGLHMVDGSGLSVLDRISPQQLVGVTEIMWRHPNGQPLIDSLPSGGEGTMTYRLPGLTVRAKTGTLDRHSGLTGYVVSAYGQTIGFSVLVNDVDATWSAVELEDHIVRTLATWGQPL